jgi:dipeptidyl aminopeptidase/acylaminoacyl peptidase
MTNSGFASPSTTEVTGITAPLLMFHGTTDTTVLPAQSATLQGILNTNGVPNKRLLYQGSAHPRRWRGSRRLAHRLRLYQ